MNYYDITSNFISIIEDFEGVIGALLGVIITVLLNEYLKYKGKLIIYITDYIGTLVKYTMGVIDYNVDNIEEALYYEFKFELQAHNESDCNRVLREIEIEFICKNEIITCEAEVVKAVNLSEDYLNYGKIKVLNVKPKEIIILKIKGVISNDSNRFIELNNIKKINLKAKDDKNKIKRYTIKKY